MKWLSNSSVERLRKVADWPDLTGTRYEIAERIGHGGMGVVYRAHDQDLQRDVALKVLHAANQAPGAGERMMAEARILARLEHPGIVPVHDVRELPDGRMIYAMKLVKGESLEQRMPRIENANEFLRVFERICEAVAFAHAHGVIHRDLKPANIMMGPFGEVLVMDWGVAKLVADPDPPATVVTSSDSAAATSDATKNAATKNAAVQPGPLDSAAGTVPLHDGNTLPGTILGTPGYMSPEQARGKLDHVDRRTDVYALGAVLREYLSDGRSKVPRRLRAIYTKALEPDPGARYPSVEELREDVSRYLSGESVHAYHEPPWERVGRVLYRYRTPLLLFLAYLIMRLLLLVFADA